MYRLVVLFFVLLTSACVTVPVPTEDITAIPTESTVEPTSTPTQTPTSTPTPFPTSEPIEVEPLVNEGFEGPMYYKDSIPELGVPEGWELNAREGKRPETYVTGDTYTEHRLPDPYNQFWAFAKGYNVPDSYQSAFKGFCQFEGCTFGIYQLFEATGPKQCTLDVAATTIVSRNRDNWRYSDIFYTGDGFNPAVEDPASIIYVFVNGEIYEYPNIYFTNNPSRDKEVLTASIEFETRESNRVEIGVRFIYGDQVQDFLLFDVNMQCEEESAILPTPTPIGEGVEVPLVGEVLVDDLNIRDCGSLIGNIFNPITCPLTGMRVLGEMLEIFSFYFYEEDIWITTEEGNEFSALCYNGEVFINIVGEDDQWEC